MASENQTDWLPPEWVEVKDYPEGKVKHYRNTQTGQTFFTKEDVIRYIKMVNNSNSPPQPMEEDNDLVHDETNTVVVKSIKVPEWLPRGWTMELRSRNNGPLVKCFVPPEGKRRFYSKPQVFRYLETVNNSPATQEEPNVVNETGEKSSPGFDAFQRDGIPDGWTVETKVKGSGANYKPNVVNETGEKSSPGFDAFQRDGVPDGWTVETKVKRSGAKYKIYIAPSGRKFFSKPQVYGYLKTLNSSLTAPERFQQSVNEISGDNCSSEPYVSVGCKTLSTRRSITKQMQDGDYIPTQRVVVNDTALTNETESNKEDILPNMVNETGENFSPEFDASERNGVPEWLPQGWTVKTKFQGSGASKGKKVKCYIAPNSGHKCYSKPQVYDYLKIYSSPVRQERVQQRADQLSGENCSSEPVVSEERKPISIQRSITKPKKSGDNGSSLKNNKVTERGPADGLPPGWIREIRTREHGALQKKDPFFIDPSSGYVFRSKRDALRYLETGNIGSCVCRPQKMVVNDIALVINDTESIKEDTLVNDKAAVDGLPPGWIKEVRSKKTASGIRMDPYFIDPLSGYEFRSKPDALRYLKTGDIKSCAIKPKRGDKGTKSTNEDDAPLSAATTLELAQSSTAKELFPGRSKPGNSDSAAKGENSSISTSILQQHNLLANGTRTGTRSSKSKNKATTPPPGRSSKRLKRAEPEIKSDPLISERAIRSATRGKSKKSVAEPESETNKVENPADDLGQPERGNTDKPNGEQITEGQSELYVSLGDPLGLDLDLDPCLEFAVKTLAGEIPVQDNLVTEGMISQQPSWL